MELFKASNQWATRPADQRFWTVEEMRQMTHAYAEKSGTKAVPYRELRAEAIDDNVMLTGRSGIPATLTNWSFSQLASRAGAPASYLRRLPATLAVQNLNHGLKARSQTDAAQLAEREGKDAGSNPHEAVLFFHQNGGLTLRAVTSKVYERVFNYEIADRLIGLQDQGWRVPPARPAGSFGGAASAVGDGRTRIATPEDCLQTRDSYGLSVKPGDVIAPAGVYASDHDCFVFMINEGRRIADGTDGGLIRGFFVGNSEVGASSIWAMSFLLKTVCGNHIVWGAQDVIEVRIRHTKGAEKRWKGMTAELRQYADASASEDEAAIRKAQTIRIGTSKDETIDNLMAAIARTRVPSLPRKLLGEAYDVAEQNEDEYGSPQSPWGMVNGLTELSQRSGFTDQRTEVDRTAGRLLQIESF